MNAEQIARVCHEANKAYCETNGDLSHAEWDDAKDELKASVIAGVRYKLDNPGVTPEQSHQSWLDFKAAEGWKYGPDKNFTTKEHPCFVPYAELPEFDRKKDELFLAIVNALK